MSVSVSLPAIASHAAPCPISGVHVLVRYLVPITEPQVRLQLPKAPHGFQKASAGYREKRKPCKKICGTQRMTNEIMILE